ncbi:crotonase/enoyl-CoA hydratase family protein [Novosphingobium pentaromativorans]|uniref:Enoyl-CoA hydratase/isomerase n=1 Tax=Novosphingobium pentaromativorans US6-1 TaxID=1088721 RepID=G6EDA2_9SPHN|nr:crotonase/enoyl-CoA hydratase family protein [Novosphingobium pentaromativorans]AIT79811.1 enoyl-CoA hydratase [Novosphingobium pentaromativorans US6-1]EHJ60701.1 Enoyl-CoA hydratase/isomerase [Novosphingobium pentaromativorans US6-1]
METILTDIENSILTITLNRPDKLNAFNAKMATELLAAFDRADSDDDVRAIIVTGAGRGFCAGADLSGGSATFDFENRPDKAALGSPIRPDGTVDYGHEAVRDHAGRVSMRIHDLLKPVIGAINGAAVGAGITMTLAMDVRLVSENAKIGFPFVRRGIVPEGTSSYFLPRLVGISQAMEWCATGRVFDAQEALAGGLVRSVHAPDDLLPSARKLAAEMAEGAPVAMALTRQMMWRGLGYSSPMEAHRIESRGVYTRGQTADVKEGVDAFLEKRAASFPDKVSKDMPDYFPWWTSPEFG